MTPRGHFIINGSHRIIISQMSRAPGLYYQTGEKPQATIVPKKGAWLRISAKVSDNGETKIWVKITPQRKMPYKIFIETYKYLENQKNVSTLVGSSLLSFLNLTYKSVNSKIKHFDKHIAYGVVSGQISRTLLNGTSYSLGSLGRKRLNERLGINEKTGHLTSKDISIIKDNLLKMLDRAPSYGPSNQPFEAGRDLSNQEPTTGFADDIDNLENRRVRTCGELLQSEIEVGMTRLKKAIGKQLDDYSNPDSSLFTTLKGVDKKRTDFKKKDKNPFTKNKFGDLANQGPGLVKEPIFTSKNTKEEDVFSLSLKKVNFRKEQVLSRNTPLESTQDSFKEHKNLSSFKKTTLKPVSWNYTSSGELRIVPREQSKSKGYNLQKQSTEKQSIELGFINMSQTEPKVKTWLPIHPTSLNSVEKLTIKDLRIQKYFSKQTLLFSLKKPTKLKVKENLLKEKKKKILLEQNKNTKKNSLNNFFNEKGKIKDKILSPSKIVGTKAFAGALREFFGSNPLSQYMDQTNPLAEITHKRRLSSLGPGGVDRSSAGIAIRGIHPSHYGRICPIETPEGKNAGLVNSMTMWVRVNKDGFLETPYLKVKGGSLMSHNNNLFPQWHFLPTKKESNKALKIVASDLKIAESSFLPKMSLPTRDGSSRSFGRQKRDVVNLFGVSPIQNISVATSLIPFLEHDDATRALMGSNMLRQAVPLLKPQGPLVRTGLEGKVVGESGHALQAACSGIISTSTRKCISIDTFKTNQNSLALTHTYITSFLPFLKKKTQIKLKS